MKAATPIHERLGVQPSRARVSFRASLMGLFGLCVLASAAEPVLQKRPRISSQLSPSVVKVGGQTRLIIVTENARRAQIVEVPSVEGIEIGGFSSTTRQTVVNGRVSRSLSWRASVRPLKTGDLVVPPITLLVDGQRLRTKALALKVVEDLRGAELGFMEVVDAPEQVYEGQPFSLTWRFGFDASLSVRRATLFLPWWEQLPGTLTLEEERFRVGARRLRLGLNNNDEVDVEEVEMEKVDGRDFRIFYLRRNLMPTRAGSLDFPVSYFEFVQLLKRGSLRTRDQTESFYVNQPEFSIEVRELPEEGRPYDFSGAVGSFSLEASVDRRDVDAGDSIKFSVDFSGEGNLEYFEPPDPSRLESFEGFRFYGQTERKSFGSRRITYDIAPISPDLREIPSLPLRAFDPEFGEYVTLSTEPIPIRVRALEGDEVLSGTGNRLPGLDIRDIQPRFEPESPIGRPGSTAVGLGLAGVPILWLGLRMLARRRGAPDAPAARRRRAARRRLARCLRSARTAADQAQALHSFLAARSDEAEQTWVGRDVLAHAMLEDVPIERDHALELAGLLRDLDRRTYAASNEMVAADRVLAVADRLLGGGL